MLNILEELRLEKLKILKSIKILQGGMGFYVSNNDLARAVAICGQAGIVSGTGLAIVIARRLQDGDPGGHIRRALDHFPKPEIAEEIWDKYYIAGGRPNDTDYIPVPVPSHKPGKFAINLFIVANFVEIWLAKQGHNGLIGVNYLEKLQTPHLYEVFGAMLAGVDFVIVGAGLGGQFPKMIHDLYNSEAAHYKLNVTGTGSPTGKGDDRYPDFIMEFDPKSIISHEDFQRLELIKPLCLFIVSTPAAANILLRMSGDFPPDGFVVEGPKAGGHNAPPRGRVVELNERGEPIYNLEGKDNPGYAEIKAFGLPFWIAGESCSPEALQFALEQGAQGVQIGTAFSLCRESGIQPEIKQRSVQDILNGTYDVYTSLKASPTKFPFKVVMREGTMWDLKVYNSRTRICDLGYLREAYWYTSKRGEYTVGWRCSSEPIDDYILKGGKLEDTDGSMCVCNGLTETVGCGHGRGDGIAEAPLITSGDNTDFLLHMPLGDDGLYGAKDVLYYVLGS